MNKLFKKEAELLRHTMTQEETKLNTFKIECVLKFRLPKIWKQLSNLGYYRKFI